MRWTSVVAALRYAFGKQETSSVRMSSGRSRGATFVSGSGARSTRLRASFQVVAVSSSVPRGIAAARQQLLRLGLGEGAADNRR